MSEEQEQEGTWSGLKKTIVGVLGTIVTAGGVFLTTLLGGGDKEAAPAPAAPTPASAPAPGPAEERQNTITVKFL